MVGFTTNSLRTFKVNPYAVVAAHSLDEAITYWRDECNGLLDMPHEVCLDGKMLITFDGPFAIRRQLYDRLEGKDGRLVNTEYGRLMRDNGLWRLVTYAEVLHEHVGDEPYMISYYEEMFG